MKCQLGQFIHILTKHKERNVRMLVTFILTRLFVFKSRTSCYARH